MKKKLNAELEKELIKEFKDGILSRGELKNKYNIDSHRLSHTLNEYSIENKRRRIDRFTKYHCDESYFEQINTEEKAYILGVLMADGYISDRKTNYVIGLTMIDKDVIEKFQIALKSDYPIVTRNQSSNKIRRKDAHTILISNKKMIKDLAKWGVINKKSYRTFIPAIEEGLLPHFIRGYFDGDGCIYVRQKTETRHCHCSITSSSQVIIHQIKKILEKNGISTHIRQSKTTYLTIITENEKDSIKFLNYIYSNATIYMDRKYHKYITIKNKPLRIKRINCSSQYFGVSKKGDVFIARISLNNKRINIGRFKTEKEAAIAYNCKITELGLSQEMLNKIED